MRHQGQQRVALLGFALLSLASRQLGGQETTPLIRLTLNGESRLSIEGTSNLHAWRCRATVFEASISIDPSRMPAAPASIDIARSIRRVDVKVPVQSLKCGNGRMDRIMYQALRADEPAADSIVGSFEVVPGTAIDSLVVHTVGTLRVAGQENVIRIDVRTQELANGLVRVVSELPILMTDYGVKPPTVLLGALRCGNRVMVKFELVVAPHALLATSR